MKTWYNYKGWKLFFKAGDEVLILYLFKVNHYRPDHVVHTPRRCKGQHFLLICSSCIKRGSHMRQTIHNIIATCSVVAEVNHDVGRWCTQTHQLGSHSKVTEELSHLTPIEQNDIEKLLLEFQYLFPNIPNCTTNVFYDNEVGSAWPCRKYPYRVNPIKLQYLWKEIEYNYADVRHYRATLYIVSGAVSVY